MSYPNNGVSANNIANNVMYNGINVSANGAGVGIYAPNIYAPNMIKSAESDRIYFKGGNLDLNKNLFPALTIPYGHDDYNISPWLFHLCIWEHSNSNDIKDYDILKKQKASLLAFNTYESKQKFLLWFEKYKSFYKNIDTYVPLITNEKFIQGHIINYKASIVQESEHGYNKYITQTDVELWSWIIENCVASVKFATDFILFENEMDAVNFKLRWN